MKVVVQNGANHALTRGVVEELVQHMPQTWKAALEQIVILASCGAKPTVAFHSKSKSLEICGPEDRKLLPQFVSELLISCSIIAEDGDMPGKISPSLRRHHAAVVSGTFALMSLH